MTLVFSILYNMRITKTSEEIVAIINEAIGMDISHVDFDGDIKIDAWDDAEGNEICLHDFMFCGGTFYYYVNQQGLMDGKPYFTLNTCPVDDDAEENDKCFNREGEHGEYDDYCTCVVNDDDVEVWTFDEDTFNNTLEGLKTVLKVKNEQQLVILDDEEEFVV